MYAFARLLRDDGGATMAEYALVLSLVAIVCVVAVKSVGQNTSQLFQTLATSM